MILKGSWIFQKNYAKKQYSSGLSSENSEITKSEVPWFEPGRAYQVTMMSTATLNIASDWPESAEKIDSYFAGDWREWGCGHRSRESVLTPSLAVDIIITWQARPGSNHGTSLLVISEFSELKPEE